MELFVQNVIVRWSDLDPNGHVRHSVYYDFGAQARVAFLHSHGFDIAWMADNSIGPVLFREEAKFFRELNSGDRLVIDVQLSGLSGDRRKWGMRHRIMRGDELCAVLDAEGAWLDLEKRKLTVPPKELVENLEHLTRTDDFHEMS